LRAPPPVSLKAARDKIHELTGLTRSPPQGRPFRLSLGMRPRQVGLMPAKGEAPQPDAVKKKELAPRLTAAQAAQRVVDLMEAAHCVVAPVLGYLWSLRRLLVRAPAGRKRLKVLGALKAIPQAVVTVTKEA
jgi:hypothetical protein